LGNGLFGAGGITNVVWSGGCLVSSCWSLLPTRLVAIDLYDCLLFSLLQILQVGQIYFCFHEAFSVLLHSCFGSGRSVPPQQGRTTQHYALQ
jgi:hypothetical protein